MSRPNLVVAIAAEDPALRVRISSALVADSVVPADASTGDPDVCVIPGDASTRQAAARLRAQLLALGATPVVVVARDPSPACVRRLATAGVHALVIEEDLERTVAAAVRAAAVGLSVTPVATADWVEKPSFSYRELQVLRLAVAGRTNAEVGLRLRVAESTVKGHLSSAYRKLGVGSRQDAARILLDPEQGLSHLLEHENERRPARIAAPDPVAAGFADGSATRNGGPPDGF